MIDFRILDESFKLMYSVTANDIKGWPGYQFWNPVKLLHTDVYPDMLIVQSENVESGTKYISLLALYFDDKGIDYIFDIPN